MPKHHYLNFATNLENRHLNLLDVNALKLIGSEPDQLTRHVLDYYTKEIPLQSAPVGKAKVTTDHQAKTLRSVNEKMAAELKIFNARAQDRKQADPAKIKKPT